MPSTRQQRRGRAVNDLYHVVRRGPAAKVFDAFLSPQNRQFMCFVTYDQENSE